MRKCTEKKRQTTVKITAKAERTRPARCNPFAGGGNGFSTYNDILDQTEERASYNTPEMRF